MRRIAIALILASCLSQLAFTFTLAQPIPQKKSRKTAAPAQPPVHVSKEDGIKWEPWSDDLFERAKRENKSVILDLEAVWCHWCHVMEEETYSEADVANLIKEHYIAVRVDQDSRPDLSNRYEDYGWPATIIFNSKGQEVAKRSGFIPPQQMLALLKEIVKDPTPGPSIEQEKPLKVASNAFLSPRVALETKRLFRVGYDVKEGGWGFSHKYLDWDSVEYCLTRARSGDLRAERMAKQTLKAQLQLIDPAWGGVYQYSTGGNWHEPHFEKIMSMQAENMRIYAQAYLQWPEPEFLKAMQDIHGYLKNFLTSPEGAFYTSQDADLVQGEHSAEYFNLGDAERRKLGIPRVDTNIYARENGWVINSLVAVYATTGDKQYLDEAVTAAQWIIKHRSLPGGGFRHSESETTVPYLGDNVAMGNALLKLYMATGDRQWLKRSEEVIAFIAANFKSKDGSIPGFATARLTDSGLQPKPQRDENVLMTRYANLLFHYTGKAEYRQLAEDGMRYLAIREIATRRPPGGVLLADLEMAADPAHITVIGAKDDAQAALLFKSALAYPSGYKRVEWLDRREGALPNADIEYPELNKAAAFACANQRCSLPAFNPAEVRDRVEKLQGKKAN